MDIDLHVCKNERGLIVVVLLGLVIVVGVIGLAALSMMSSIHRSAVRYVETTQAFYLAEGVLEHGVKYLTYHSDSLSFTWSADVSEGRCKAWVDTMSSPYRLVAESVVGDARRVLSLRLEDGPPTALPRYAKAVYSTGDVYNVTTLDEAGNPVDSLRVANADSLPPTINTSPLAAMAWAQGHGHTGNYAPPDGYPNGTFYYSQGVPNITHVTGDLTVRPGRTVHGIFVVDGDVTLQAGAQVDGVLYLPNSTSTVTKSGGNPSATSVIGSIIGGGSIAGTNNMNVQLNTEYLTSFLIEGEAEDSYYYPPVFHSWRED